MPFEIDRAIETARRHGLSVWFEHFGEWDRGELRAEYDPTIAQICVNANVVRSLPESERDRFVAMAIGHEIYHHLERCGEVERQPSRARREAAAHAYAHGLLVADDPAELAGAPMKLPAKMSRKACS